MKLNCHRFGLTDLKVSTLCLGTSNFARYANQEESFAMLDLFRDAGGNFVQTSGTCPGINLGDGFFGLPEMFLGQWLRQRGISHDQITIATRLALTRPLLGGVDGFARLIRSCVEDSVRRIGSDYLDMLVIEWTDAMTPLSESMAAFENVIRSGLVRHIVPANFPISSVSEALNASRSNPRRIVGLQIDYSLVVRAPHEIHAAKYLADSDLAAIARSPLAGGYLTGTPGDQLMRVGQDDREVGAAVKRLWPILSEIALRYRCSPAQVSLAWVHKQPQVTSVLISVRSTKQLRALIAAPGLPLTARDIACLSGDTHQALLKRM